MDMSVIEQSLPDADTDKDTAISRGTVKPERITLDSYGDVVLAVSDPISGLKREFLVSSTVLCLASDYFKTLLTSDFKEACQLRTEVCPTITMEDDDVDAMLVVLSIMHFKHQ
jgi:BTB/POZ domain-containing protein